MGTLAAVLVLAGLLVLTLAGCFVLGPWPFALLAACFYAASRLLRQRPAGQEPGLPAPG